MARFVKGDVVVVPFPFSDLSQSKRRPTLIIASLEGEDAILWQITSKTIKESYVRPNRLFAADSHIILYRVGSIEKEKMAQVIDKIIEIIKN
jgi:mRNA interferase MazF